MSNKETMIKMARRREKKVGYTLEDRKSLLGTEQWKNHSLEDIQAYVQLLDELYAQRVG